MAYLGRQPVLGNFVKLDAITVVNGQAAYTMQNSGVNFTNYENVNQFLVSLNGILQSPGTSFSVASSTLTFASNLSTGDVIDFVLVLGNSLDIGTPSDNTVTTAKLADSSVSLAKLTATGTKDATTFLRGDNTFAVAGSPSITDNGNATAITIDSNENVGIGISPTPPSGYGGLHIHSTYPVMKLSSTATGSGTTDGFAIRVDSTPRAELWNFENTDMVFATNNTARMYIDSAGRVAIGSTTVTGARLYVPADGQTTDAWVRHGNTSSCSGSWGGSKQVQVDWQILHSVSYVLEFLTASYGSRKHFVVGSYYPGNSHQTIMTDNGGGTMTQGGASSGERWTSSGGTHGVYCVRITSAQGLDNALVTLI